MQTFLVFLLLIWCGWCYLDATFTSTDKTNLLSALVSSQDPNSYLFDDSLTSTFYAIEALQKAQQTIPNAKQLCQALDTKVKAENWEELHALILSKSRLPKCLEKVSEKTKSKILSAISSDKLSQVYYGLSVAEILAQQDHFNWGDVDLIATVKHVFSFRKATDGLFVESNSEKTTSVFRTALALSSLSKILSSPKSVGDQGIESELQLISESIEKMLGKEDQHSQYLSFSNSVTATTYVVESIVTLFDVLSKKETLNRYLPKTKLPIFTDRDFVERLARYYLQYKHTSSATNARHALVVFDLLEKSPHVQTQPIVIKVSNRVISWSSTSHDTPLTVRVTDVFGRPILRDGSVIIESSRGTKGKGPVGAFTVKAKNTEFVYNFLTELKKLETDSFGTYEVSLHIKDSQVLGNEPIATKTEVKVTTSIRSITLTARKGKKGEDAGEKIEYPATLKNSVYEIAPMSRVIFEISFKSAVNPRQIIFDFVSKKTKQSVIQVAPQVRQNVYSLSVDTNKPPFHRVLKEGEYEVNIYIGDVYLDQDVQWQNVLSASVVEEEETEAKDYEPVNDEVPRYAPKENIEHSFAPSQPQHSPFIATIFNVLVLLPFLFLLYQIFVSLNIQLSLFSGVYAIGFIICLLLNCVALFFYWYQWNIFEAMFNLFVLAIPTSFFGYSILKAHLKERSSHKKND